MKKILVITDLSRNSRAAIKFGLQAAAQAGYAVEFFHLMEIMKPTSWNDRRFADFAQHRIGELEKEVRNLVHDVATAVGFNAGLHQIKIEIGTKLVEEAVRYAKKTKAGLICLGTRGGGKIKKLLGSNAASFLISSPLPVIVIPPNYRTSTITQLMYASDFENLGTEIKKVKTLTSGLGAKLSVIHYNRTLVISQNESHLKRKSSRYIDNNTAFFFRKLEIDEPLAVQLNKDIKKQKPDALVLFTRPKRSWFNRWFSPSDSEQMVFNPLLPIIVFRKK
jgi:nucleotide-binding universal stress UspA family protein